MATRNTETQPPRSVRAPVLISGLCAMVFATSAAFARDEPGKAKAEQACVACHGPAGNRPIAPTIPRLAGQQYDYLVQVLNDYRDGRRENATMSVIARQQLKKREIPELAAYYSRQEGLTTKR